MKILVTGANGHIGSHTVRFLLKDGHKVVAFVREGADVRSLEGLDVEFRMGDIRDSSAVESAVKGCNVIVHHAAVYKFWEKNHSDIIEPAIRGAENIFNVAKKAGVKRIVYTSSAASVGLNNGPECRTADDWNDDAKNPYYVAKTESEKIAWKIAKETGVEMVAICPCVVLGPQDYRITPSTEIINSMANSTLPHMMIFKGGYNIVDVRDVAYVHARAVDMKGIG
ncbi:MAG: NAD-dependent epimerase/dehydratase family protein, partial [Spirochaetes bacterium]|nr:NAD-dependent epimerase/dehydratase family protein [Spirochaetota bacterium]